LKVVLIDSDILIEVSRGRDDAILARWNELSESNVLILCSPVTVAELWRGARPHEKEKLTELFSMMTCVPIDEEIGRRAGDYMRRYSGSYHLELADAFIAATVAVHNVAFWTRNGRHYPMTDIKFY
jgi:predicted nucleic acid-binding protein